MNANSASLLGLLLVCLTAAPEPPVAAGEITHWTLSANRLEAVTTAPDW
jgi:hypothetical protein